MKYIKKYEEQIDKYQITKNISDTPDKIYYSGVDVKKLNYFLNAFEKFNLNYSLFLITTIYEIYLYIILKTTEKIKETIALENDEYTYFGDTLKVAKTIMEIGKDVTDLSISEIENEIDAFKQSKKYNL